MEQVIVVQQSQAYLSAIIEQVRNLGITFILVDEGKPDVKISRIEEFTD